MYVNNKKPKGIKFQCDGGDDGSNNYNFDTLQNNGKKRILASSDRLSFRM